MDEDEPKHSLKHRVKKLLIDSGYHKAFNRAYQPCSQCSLKVRLIYEQKKELEYANEIISALADTKLFPYELRVVVWFDLIASKL